MKITKKQLRKIIKEEILREFITTSGATGATKKAVKARQDVKKSEKSADVKRQQTKVSQAKLDSLRKALTIAKDNVATSLKDQPDPRQHTVTKTDTTKWTHPYSSQTTALSKGQTQPKFGWEYGTQTAKSWTHPASKMQNLVTPKSAIPDLGWSIVTGGKGGKTTYGQGSQKDYEKAGQLLQKGQKISPSAPTTVNYGKAAQTFGSGRLVGLGGWRELSDLIKKGGVSVDKKTKVGSLVDPKATTNPTTTSQEDRPEWTSWSGKHSGYTSAETQAQSDYDSGYEEFTTAQAEEDEAERNLDKERGTTGGGRPPKPGEPPKDDKTGGWAGGGGGAAFGPGKGGGGETTGKKGKGKKSKKKKFGESSVAKILGGDLMNELNDIKKSLKNQKTLHKK